MIRAGLLHASIDVLLLPSQDASTIRNGHPPGRLPERYSGGLGLDGGEEIDAFVRNGGTLVALDDAADYAIQLLDLPVQRSPERPFTDGGSDHFYAPGTIFQAALTPGDPLTSGMDAEVAVYVRGRSVLTVEGDTDILGRFAEDPWRSGYALNPSDLAGSAALTRTAVGRGRVILFGFRPQHRAQTLGTFKLLFNALLLPSPE
jgi:hypothetical protein